MLQYDYSQFAFMTHTAPPVTEAEMQRVEAELGVVIPDIYKAFLRYSNGALLDGARLCSLAEISDLHKLLNIEKYLPGYLCIADENGDYEFLMDARADATTVFLVSAGSMDIDDGTVRLPSIYEWLLSGNGDDPGDPFHMYETDDPSPFAEEDWVDIVMVKRPDGMEGFRQMKQALNLPRSAADYFLQARILPFVLIEKCKRSDAEQLVRQLPDSSFVGLDNDKYQP